MTQPPPQRKRRAFQPPLDNPPLIPLVLPSHRIQQKIRQVRLLRIPTILPKALVSLVLMPRPLVPLPLAFARLPFAFTRHFPLLYQISPAQSPLIDWQVLPYTPNTASHSGHTTDERPAVRANPTSMLSADSSASSASKSNPPAGHVTHEFESLLSCYRILLPPFAALPAQFVVSCQPPSSCRFSYKANS